MRNRVRDCAGEDLRLANCPLLSLWTEIIDFWTGGVSAAGIYSAFLKLRGVFDTYSTFFLYSEENIKLW